MSPTQPQGPRESGAVPAVRGWSLVLTNIMKAVGIILAINEAAHPPAQDSVIALCALFVMGTQAVEEIALRIIDRVFGVKEPDS